MFVWNIVRMDSLKRDLVRRIINDCKDKGVHVTKDLVYFLLTLYQLNPQYQIKEGDELNNIKITEAITQTLREQNKPSLITLKNQLYFAKHYHERDETIKRHRLRLHQKTGPLVREICETDNINTPNESEKLYQKMLVVISLLSGLGSPTQASILREVSIALQSVFQPSELTQYVMMSKREKEEQLMELMCIVTGIRLFNRDCQRGGEGIDDLPRILHDALNRTRDSILEFLQRLMSKIYKLTAVAEKAFFTKFPVEDVETIYGEKEEISSERFSEKNLQWVIEMLAASRQQEIYVRKLLADVERSEVEVKNLMERLQGRIFKLHDTVKYRTAIPTIQVYPQFIDLADVWMGLQDEVIVLSHINNFLFELQNLNAKAALDEITTDDILDSDDVPTDAERLEKSMGNLITECGECPIYYPNVSKDFENINLEFLGFCASTFVLGKGTLLPGNPNNGVAKWRGKYYAFSSQKVANNFGRDPDRYIYEALNFVRNHLEYVYLFQLYDDVEALKNQEVLSAEGPQLKIRHNQTVQTDVHILPPTIDKNYTSNVWELRKTALHLATLSQYATRSTQTHASHFRHGVYVQAAPPLDKEVQTRRDNYTNTRKVKSLLPRIQVNNCTAGFMKQFEEF